ncbi:alpha/beta hydrolase [Actinokineospora sp. PR83]|uniref:alpha/beta hydrolase family protein n=1 Tax=Actinokineospora sp. PR83 TaxID=2884908 RepID=UPI001F31514B|nr:alpha/beta hydrolase [Actinokineospora sp. PR83]MCG8917203.1 alpha/beta hydrolase [Actinokineospora sp. PR83]
MAVTSNPYQRGPAPTAASVSGVGPFSISYIDVSTEDGPRFGGGRIFHPRDTGQGTFGVVAISPGGGSVQASVGWLARRLATHGFVTMAISNVATDDNAPERGSQLQAALEYLTTQAPAEVRRRADTSRLAVAGHSLGGGGALFAARSTPSLKAAFAMAPWSVVSNWSGVEVPTMLVGGSKDKTAPVGNFAIPMYQGLSNSTHKAYAELSGADHLTFTGPTPLVSTLAVSWVKRFVDGDTRYTRFLCPGPSGDGVAQYRSNCPYN